MKTTAAIVLFSVVVASSLQQVSAIDCFTVDYDTITKCDDCIRCGGNWCKEPTGKSIPHCSQHLYDNWCSGAELEELPAVDKKTTPGKNIRPQYHTTTVQVNHNSVRVPIQYAWDSSEDSKVHVNVQNTTQTDHIKYLEGNPPVCANRMCTYQVSVKPEKDFCLPNSGKYEYVNMRVRVDNLTEEAVLKYYVPCACACSDEVERDAKHCNGNGNLACGVCACHEGWAGDFCEIDENPPTKSESGRGDLKCTNSLSNVDCSGNGVCDQGESCVCDTTRDGSQYFQQENNCADLCMKIDIDYESCIQNMRLGKCKEHPTLTNLLYNETALSERDAHNRKVWVDCEVENNTNTIYFKAKMDDRHEIYVMAISNSNSDRYVANSVNVMLPTVLGVIALVAAVTAVAGYMAWKAKSEAPQQTSAQYATLDGTSCTNENPLYKNPTSSYKNPQYLGKV